MKRDLKALQRRRLRAARLLERGIPQAEVARLVGVFILWFRFKCCSNGLNIVYQEKIPITLGKCFYSFLD